MKVQSFRVSKNIPASEQVGKLTVLAEHDGEARFLATLNKLLTENDINKVIDYIIDFDYQDKDVNDWPVETYGADPAHRGW